MSTSAALIAKAALPLRGPFRLAVALLVVTTITILKGALTTSTGSGMAFTDWPFSDGEVMPERSWTTLPGFLEHFHRVFGAFAGLLVLSLTCWLHFGRSGDGGRLASARARRTAWFGLGLIVVQGVIGGVGVLHNLPVVTSATHGTLAQVTLATFAWLAYQLSDRYAHTAPCRSVAPHAGRKLMSLAVGILIVQTVVGALARHANSPHALWTHVGNAFVVFVMVAIAAAFATGRLKEVPGVKGLAQTLVLLLILQIGLGFVALAIRNQAGKVPENVDRLGAAVTISVHVLLGALLTMLTATLAAHVFRATRRPDVEPVA